MTRDSSPTAFPISRVLSRVRQANSTCQKPSVTKIASQRDPFHVLVATILSLRTKDETTEVAARRLLKVAGTPHEVLRLRAQRIERLIYPVGFYRTKARRLRQIAKTLLENHDGGVPRDLETLLSLDGVGRKTANLVLTQGHDLPGICVDIHVHRITNRWGYVLTKAPDPTEMRLREVLPKRHWKEINDLLVTFGKTLCRPISPHCSKCPLTRYCKQVGVTTTR